MYSKSILESIKPTILVLGVSGNVSAGILRVLRKNFPKAYILSSCIKESFNSIYSDLFILSPYANDATFVKWLNDVCNNYEVDVVVSGVEEVNEVLVYSKLDLEANGKTKIAVSSSNAVFLGADKFKTAEWLKSIGLSYPRSIIPNSREDIIMFLDHINGPAIIKPLAGKGSIGLHILRSKNDVYTLDLSFDQFVLQELIGDEDNEYTVGCFQLKNGTCVDPIVMRRRLDSGNTVFAQIVDNHAIKHYCLDITRKLNPMGPLNIQLRLDSKGSPICFELNVRFSGTTVIRDYFGFKDVVFSILEKLNIDCDLSYFQYRKSGTCIRQMSELFFDTNDLLKAEIQRFD
jgi:carbamoyl-phosphate synthase large subunit